MEYEVCTTVTEEGLYNYCRDYYYSYDDVLCQLYEDCDKEEIEKLISGDVENLKSFFEMKQRNY